MINLLPIEEKKKIKKEYFFRFLTVFLMMMFATIIIATSFFIPAYLFSFIQKKTTGEELSVIILGQKVNLAEDQKIIEETKNKISILSANDSNIPYPTVAISAALRLKPENVTINSISYHNNKNNNLLMTVSGISTNRDSLISYKRFLEKDGFFKKIDLPVSNLVADKDLEFSMNLTTSK